MTIPKNGQLAHSDEPARSATGTLGFWRDLLFVTFFAVAGLIYAAGVLIPLAIALLLFILLTAVIDRIARFDVGGSQVPRWLAHVLGFGLVLFGLLVVLSILSNQAGSVVDAIPRYQERFSGILSRVIALVGDDNYASAQAALNDMKIADYASGALSSAGGFLSGLFLVLLYIPFMFLERAPMRTKIALAAPDPEFAAMLAKVLGSISVSLQSYVGIKTFVSLLTGLATYAVTKPAGLDFAETWAVLAFLLNFIPTIGSIIAASLPAIVALVQFDTFTPFLMIAAGCGLAQFLIGNLLEPSLTGRTLNLSPLTVILALTFWGAMWGIAGAFLSVPITVCALVVLSHVPATQPLAILMSGDGKLVKQETPEEGPPQGKLNRQTEADPAQGDFN